MSARDVYKLAFAHDPTVAVADAAAAVGLPRNLTKLAGVARSAAQVAKRFRSAPKRISEPLEAVARKHGPGASSPLSAAPVGLGKRIAQNWWTFPAAGLGVYGLSTIPGEMSAMAGGGGGGAMQGGYGATASSTSPAQQRYQQMQALARQYGYI